MSNEGHISESKKLGLAEEDSDGIRVKALKRDLNHSVESISCIWRPSLFLRCFPSYECKKRKELDSVRVQLIGSVQKAIYINLESYINEFYDPLNRLNAILKKYKGTKTGTAWRPFACPEVDVRSHDAQILFHENQRALESLAIYQKKTEILLKKVLSKRKMCDHNSMVHLFKKLFLTATNQVVQYGLDDHKLTENYREIKKGQRTTQKWKKYY